MKKYETDIDILDRMGFQNTFNKTSNFGKSGRTMSSCELWGRAKRREFLIKNKMCEIDRVLQNPYSRRRIMRSFREKSSKKTKTETVNEKIRIIVADSE